MEEHVGLKKKAWGDLKGVLGPSRHARPVVDPSFSDWSEETENPGQPPGRLLGIAKASFTTGAPVTARSTEHNGKIPRDFWLEDWERSESIINYYLGPSRTKVTAA